MAGKPSRFWKTAGGGRSVEREPRVERAGGVRGWDATEWVEQTGTGHAGFPVQALPSWQTMFDLYGAAFHTVKNIVFEPEKAERDLALDLFGPFADVQPSVLGADGDARGELAKLLVPFAILAVTGGEGADKAVMAALRLMLMEQVHAITPLLPKIRATIDAQLVAGVRMLPGGVDLNKSGKGGANTWKDALRGVILGYMTGGPVGAAIGGAAASPLMPKLSAPMSSAPPPGVEPALWQQVQEQARAAEAQGTSATAPTSGGTGGHSLTGNGMADAALGGAAVGTAVYPGVGTAVGAGVGAGMELARKAGWI